MNFSQKELVEALKEAGSTSPQADMRKLYDSAFDSGNRAPESQEYERPNEMTLELYEIYISERLKGRPVSQIIGKRDFWRHEFEITSDVLDPRPDTETLVEQALSQPFNRVLDLGTGSGCIIISLLADKPSAQGVAVDASEKALEIAAKNAKKIGVTDRLVLKQSNWFSNVQGRYDLIVSNPPYITASAYEKLDKGVREFEPEMALLAGEHGLDAYRNIIAEAPNFLTPDGRLIVEIGFDQRHQVMALFKTAGLKDINCIQDINGKDRCISGVFGD